jgi:hypothetical protein
MKKLIALEARAGRHRDREHPIFDRDAYPLGPAPSALAPTGTRPGLARLLHAGWLDRGRTLQPLQSGDLGPLLRHHLLQRRGLAQKREHQRLVAAATAQTSKLHHRVGQPDRQPNNHRSFDLPIANVLHTSSPHHYKEAKPGESEEDFATRLAQDLEDLIVAEGPDTIAAMFGEPVMGAGGVVVPPRTYWSKIQAVLRKYDILFVADEVICGFGSTGMMFGSARS